MAKTITNTNIDSVIRDNSIVVMDFWAEWCAPCKTLSTVIDRISMTNNDILVGKIDVDDNSDLANRYGIRSVPTLLFIKNGEIVNKSVGIKSDVQIQQIINSLR